MAPITANIRFLMRRRRALMYLPRHAPAPYFFPRIGWAGRRPRRIAKIQAAHRCQRCGRFAPEPNGLHVHHRKPVERAPALMLEPANLLVLCPQCHNIVEPRTGLRRMACDEQGRPLDPEHPWNLKAGAGRSNDPA